ncbi:unnamed protein product, partial [Rotaria sp. Silwood2]
MSFLGIPINPGNTKFGANALSFSFYASIYNNRHDISCLIHLRTAAVAAVSAMKFGLLCLCQEACICGPTTSHEIKIDVLTNRLSIDDSIHESKAK